jgi:hypothetical protein
MDEFKGSLCIVCGKPFDENDDIVVCPDCGTPYHRACYKSVGSCINKSLHESGEAWKPDPGVVPDDENETLCRRCGKQNPPGTLMCEGCGAPLDTIINEKYKEEKNADTEEIQDNYFLNPLLVNFSDPCCGLNPNEDFDGVKVSEIADYVDKNTHYYIPLFKGFKTIGKQFSWNWAAMVFPEFYFAYRKMFLPAIAAVILRLLISIPSLIMYFSNVEAGQLTAFASTFDIKSNAFSMVSVIVTLLDYAKMFFFATAANGMYYKKAVRDIKKTKLTAAFQTAGVSPDDDAKSVSHVQNRYTPNGFIPNVYSPPVKNSALTEALRKKGGVSVFWLTVFVCLTLMPFVLLSMNIDMNSYMNNI